MRPLILITLLALLLSCGIEESTSQPTIETTTNTSTQTSTAVTVETTPPTPEARPVPSPTPVTVETPVPAVVEAAPVPLPVPEADTPAPAPAVTPVALPPTPAPAEPVIPAPTPKKSMAQLEIDGLTKIVFGDWLYEIIEGGFRVGIALGVCPTTTDDLTNYPRCLDLRWTGWTPGVGYSGIAGYITSTPERAQIWRNSHTYPDGSSLDLHIITFRGKVLGIEVYIKGEVQLLVNVEYDGKYFRRYTQLPTGLVMDPACVNSPYHPGWVGFGKCN